MSGMFDEELGRADPAIGQPIPLKASVGEASDFPIEALPPTIAGAITAIADIVQIPLATAANGVLASAALVSQCRYNVELPTRQVVPTSLFLFSVNQSGDRKSTADAHALLPVREREKHLKAELAEKESRYEIDLAAYEAAKSAAKRTKGGRSEIAAALGEVGRPPVKPAAGILITDEGTVPGIQKLFAEAMPSLGLFSDDGASWLGGYSMQDENQAATGASLSHLWDGKPVKRVRTTGFEIHYGRRLSLHLMVQPGVALKLFGNKALRDQGLMSRILVAFPKSLRGGRFWREVTDDTWKRLREYQEKLGRRLRLDMRFVDEATRELEFDVLKLSAAARAAWIEFSDHCEKLQGPGGAYEDIGDFASKMAENATRIAAVLASFERTPDALAEEGISEGFMRAGIRIVQFYAAEAVRLFSAGSVDDDSDNAALLIEWIRKRGLTQVGTQYLSQSAPKSVRPARILKRAIELLVEHRHLHPIKGGAMLTLGGKSKFYVDAYNVMPEAE